MKTSYSFSKKWQNACKLKVFFRELNNLNLIQIEQLSEFQFNDKTSPNCKIFYSFTQKDSNYLQIVIFS